MRLVLLFLALVIVAASPIAPGRALGQSSDAVRAGEPASAAFIKRLEQVHETARALGRRAADDELTAPDRERFFWLESELAELIADPQLLAIDPADNKIHWLHYTEREGLTNGYRKLVSEDGAAAFDSKVLILDALGTTFETDWFGFANNFVYLLNEKFRDPLSYQKAARLLGVHAAGCGPKPGRVPEIAEICLAGIGRNGFASMGEFEVALEWAREAATIARKFDVKDIHARVNVFASLAELEIKRGTKAAASKALAEIPPFTDSEIEDADFMSGTSFDASDLRARIAAVRNQIERQNDDIEDDLGIAVERFTNPANELPAIEVAELGSRLLAASRAGRLSNAQNRALRQKVGALAQQYGVNRQVGRHALSSSKQDDLAVLAGFHVTFMDDNFLARYADQLYERNYERKQQLSARLYDRIYEDDYAQWGSEIDFFADMAKMADAIVRLGYPLSAQMVRENMVRLLSSYSSDAADRLRLQTDLAQPFLNTHAALADFFIRAKRRDQAWTSIVAMSAIASGEIERNWKGGRQDLGQTIVLLSPHINQAIALQDRLEAELGGAGRDAAFELAFRNMQLAQLGDVALAMQAGARRSVLIDDEVAAAVQEYEEAGDRLTHLTALGGALSYFMSDGIDGAIDDARKLEAQASARVGRVMPFVESFASVAPVGTEAISKVLAGDEALVAMVEIGDRTKLFAVSPGRKLRAVSAISSAELHQRIVRLRDGLDPDAVDLADPQSFDHAQAHELFVELLAPLMPALQGVQRIVVVGRGATASLPLHLLLEEPPAAGAGFESMAWLARRFAFATAPSVATLAARRASLVTAADQDRKPLIGVGDPLFSRDAQDGATRVASADIARAFRGTRADLELLSTLAPLPDTREELTEIAGSVRADANDLLFGTDASETRLKALNREGRLADYRIVYFATHGLVAGELNGDNEPGLVLSLPAQPDGVDDGLLTASEIADFNLRAEMVVLSACNTAAPGGEGGEAFTGLAKAFFSAGAGSVLASHWPVVSAAAVALTTDTFSALARDGRLGPAQALRLAMLKLIEAGGFQAHPAYWGPFVIIGDG